ncbi:MAG: hypothetical protein B7Y84_05665 [Azorhizobium sp. 32-67-21]|nr:MAG: hypothetical protein B7Y84_05665 [Azorhizobium sp. 32-67-21]
MPIDRDGRMREHPAVPAVSICIPVASQLEGLERTLDSLVEQRFLDYEVVIADDSPDGSSESLIASYDFGGRLRHFANLRPLGTPMNWDEAIRQSQSPLIKMLLPGDRFAGRDALGRFVALLEGAPDAIIGCASLRVEDAAVRPAPPPEMQQAIRRTPDRLLRGNVIGPIGGTIHRRSAILDFDPRLRHMADVDFYIRALRSAPRLAVEEDILVIQPAEHVSQAPLGEILIIFEKAVDLLQHDPEVAAFLWRILRQKSIRNERQLARQFQLSPVLSGYFRHLFAHPPREAGGSGLIGLLRRVGPRFLRR